MNGRGTGPTDIQSAQVTERASQGATGVTSREPPEQPKTQVRTHTGGTRASGPRTHKGNRALLLSLEQSKRHRSPEKADCRTDIDGRSRRETERERGDLRAIQSAGDR